MGMKEISNMRKNAGFTTVELFITIAIVGILSVIGIPNFLVWRANSKLIGTSHNLRGDLEKAKMKAIRENARVAVVFTATGYTIFIDNGAGGGTADNWIQDGSEILLRNRQMVPGIAIDLAATTFAADRTRFDGRGLPGVLGRVVIAGSTGTRQIVMNRLGRLNVQ